LHPGFEFRIGRFILLDVISHCPFIEPESGKSHCIEAFTNPRIARGKLTGLLQRYFLPEARKMDNTEWTGNAGADHWDIGIAHSNVLMFMFVYTRLRSRQCLPRKALVDRLVFRHHKLRGEFVFRMLLPEFSHHYCALVC